jgi:hypothetical protein
MTARKRSLAAISVIALLSLLLLPAPPAEAEEPRIKWIGMDSHDGMEVVDPDIALGFRKWDRLHVEVWVVSGGPVDVYMMNSKQYGKYADGGSFKAEVKKENTEHTKFTFENPDDSTWYLVIDNMDNARSGDAIPTSDVEYQYVADIEERHQEVELQQIYMTGAAVAAIIIIATVVYVMRILKR